MDEKFKVQQTEIERSLSELHAKADEVILKAQEAAEQTVQLAASVDRAIEIAVHYGGIDGGHHKAWVIDQMVRALTGPLYETVVAEACAGEDGPETYSWDVGIAP